MLGILLSTHFVTLDSGISHVTPLFQNSLTNLVTLGMPI